MGGGLFAIFLQTFIFSFYKFGITGLHVFLYINYLVFLISLFYFSKETFKFFNLKSFVLLFCFLISIGLNHTEPKENIFWLVGALAYVVPLTFLFLFCTFFLKYLMIPKVWYIVAMLFFALLAENNLCCAAIINIVLLLYFIVHFFILKKKNLSSIIPFIIVFLNALIIALAPGNFRRHDVISNDGFHIATVLLSTFKVLITMFFSLFRQSMLMPATVFLFFFIVRYGNCPRFNIKKNPILVLIIAFITGYVALFPVILGYGGTTSMPLRIEFTFDFIISILFFYFIIYFSFWAKEKYYTNIAYTPNLVITIGIMICLLFYAQFSSSKKKSAIALKELYNGQMKVVYETGIKTLNFIKNSKENEVVIIQGEIPESHIIKPMELNEDPTHWVNEAVADFYEKKSVKYIEY